MEPANAKFPPDVILYRQMIDRALDSEARRLFQAPIWWTSLHYEGGHKYDFLSPKLRLQILDHYEASNQEVARRYLARQDGRLFDEPLPQADEEWQPHPGLTPERMVQLSAVILAYQQRRLDHQTRAINNLRQRLERLEKLVKK